MRLAIFILAILCASLVQAAKDKDVEQEKFNTYFEGAMTIYSQFETPSKEESERFYAFVKSKWTESNCKKDCTEWGYIAAKEYVHKQNIPVKGKSDGK